LASPNREQLKQGSQTQIAPSLIRIYKVSRWPHYDADATMAVPELYQIAFRSYFLRKVSWVTG